MNIRPDDNPDSSAPSDAMRAVLNRQLSEAAPPAFETPPVIPDHALLQRVGRGAYGDVWLARNALGTLRAVKIVYRAHFDDAHPYEREFTGILKYEPLSRTHEGLVQVLHVGRADRAGCFYYVMELADEAETNEEQLGKAAEGNRATEAGGLSSTRCSPASYRPRTLRSELARHSRLPPAEAAQFALRLARALAYLHGHGLVHRDVKPSNVIFVGGQPKLADIGLVTSAGSSHSFVGTEGFIPPEGPGTPQADIYGLGKLLYELAMGRDRMEFPQLVSDVSRVPDREALLELNEVITRACAPGIRERYASATELQADLNLFLSGRSLRAARTIERHVVWLKRFAVVACLGLGLAAAAVWLARAEQRRASERARAEAILRTRAEAAERELRDQLYTAFLGEARATVRSRELGQRVRALDALRRAAAISNTAELRREVFAALALPDLHFEKQLLVGPDVTLRELDPTFERFAVCRGRGPTEIRAVLDNRLLASLPASTNLPAHFGLWSRDGRYLAVKRDLDPSGRLAEWEIWDISSLRQVILLHAVPWAALSFHPGLPQLIAAREGEVITWGLEHGQEKNRFQLANERIILLRYSPDGTRFAAVRRRGSEDLVTVNNTLRGAELAAHKLTENIGDLNWHPEGRWIAVADLGGAVRFMDSQSSEERLLGRHKAQAVRTAFSPDGHYLITGGWERELICWDARKLERAFTIGLDSSVPKFRADGRAVAIENWLGNEVSVYAFETPGGHREFAEDLGSLSQPPAFSTDGRWLAAMGQQRVGLWDLNSAGPGTMGDPGGVGRLFFSPDGSELFASIREDDCARWRIVPGTKSGAAPTLQSESLPKPDGFTSICLGSNQLVWTSTSGTRLAAPDNSAAGEEPCTRTAPGMSWVSPDGKFLLIYRSFETVLHVYQFPELAPVASLTNRASIRSFAFSPGGDEVAVASARRGEFWSTIKWERTRELTNFMGAFYSPDGRSMWLTSDFRNAGLYDRETLRELLPLPTGMLPLALSPDSRQLAVSVDLRRLQLWDLEAVRAQLRQLGLDWAEPGNR